MNTPDRIEHLPVDSLIPYARNARTHSPEQVAQIAASIREFGFTNPVLIDAALFLSAFFTVFLLGFQQQNVHGRHFLAAVVTSLGIGAAQIFLWRLVPEATPSQIAATLAGGPVGIVAAMWAHPRIARRWAR